MSKQLGERFIADLIARLPESARESVRTTLTSPDATAALEYAGAQLHRVDEVAAREQTLKQQEDRLKAWHQKLDSWRLGREADFAERERRLLRQPARGSDGDGDGDGDAPVLPVKPADPASGGLTPEQVTEAVERVLASREGAYVQFTGDATRLAVSHLRNFGEELDVTELVRHPKVRELGLEGAYRAIHADKLTALATKQQQEEREKLRREIRAEVEADLVTRRGPDLPYPMGGDSPLDFLGMPEDKRPKGDEVTAARMYTELVNQQR